jgi:hypothetical protein
VLCAEPADVVLHLTPTEIVAIVRATDKWPADVPPPDGWWTLQEKLKQGMAANPQAAAVINEKLDAR